MLLDESWDLSGQYQGFLLIRCLNEAKVSEKLLYGKDLLQTITEWVCYLRSNSFSRYSSFPNWDQLKRVYELSPFVSRKTEIKEESLQLKYGKKISVVWLIEVTQALNMHNIQLLFTKLSGKEDIIRGAVKKLVAKANEYERSLIVQPILHALQDKDPHIRIRSVHILAILASYLGEEETKLAFSHLVKIVDIDSVDIGSELKEHAIKALTELKIGKQERVILVQTLLKAARDASIDVRELAVRYLGELMLTFLK